MGCIMVAGRDLKGAATMKGFKMTPNYSRVSALQGRPTSSWLPVLFVVFCCVRAMAQPFAYVPNQGETSVAAIDTATKTVVATVEIGLRPFGGAVTPDGTRAYIPASDGRCSALVVIDTSTNTVSGSVPVDSPPWQVAITPDNSIVYATSPFTNSVFVIDRSSNTVVATVPVGTRPFGVAIAPDG